MELNADQIAAIQRAKMFFEHDYHDRGMVKWQGYYLSDHTENVQAYERKRQAATAMPVMPDQSLEDLAAVLFTAYQEQCPVLYQVKARKLGGQVAAIRTSKVYGYIDDAIVFEGDVVLPLADLQWCQLAPN